MITAWLVTPLMLIPKGTEKQCLWGKKIKSATASYNNGKLTASYGKGKKISHSILC